MMNQLYYTRANVLLNSSTCASLGSIHVRAELHPGEDS
jgi:hypothetical protein